MAAFSVKIEGEAALRGLLRDLPKQMENQILSKALRAGGNAIRKEVRAATPVRSDGADKKDAKGSIRRPGFLRRAWRVTVRRERGFVVAFVHPGGRGFYARFVEEGTSRAPAHPFFDAAVQKSIPAANAAMAATARAELTKTPIGRALLARI